MPTITSLSEKENLSTHNDLSKFVFQVLGAKSESKEGASMHSNFFADLGGDSLAAVQLVQTLKKQYDIEVLVTMLISKPLEEVARFIEENKHQKASNSVTNNNANQYLKNTSGQQKLAELSTTRSFVDFEKEGKLPLDHFFSTQQQ